MVIYSLTETGSYSGKLNRSEAETCRLDDIRIVFIAGMPRSGSTFSFNVARDVLRARGSVYQEAPPNISQELAQKRPTEITATQEAQFGTKIRTDVFIGNVKVVDPQFTLTSDRLTVHLNRDEDGGGLNEAEAQGNVVIVQVNQPENPGATGQAWKHAGADHADRSRRAGRRPVATAHDLNWESGQSLVQSERRLGYFNRLAANDTGRQYACRDRAWSADGALQRR